MTNFTPTEINLGYTPWTRNDGNRRLIYVSVAGVSVLLSDMEDVVNEFKRRAEITPQ